MYLKIMQSNSHGILSAIHDWFFMIAFIIDKIILSDFSTLKLLFSTSCNFEKSYTHLTPTRQAK